MRFTRKLPTTVVTAGLMALSMGTLSACDSPAPTGTEQVSATDATDGENPSQDTAQPEGEGSPRGDETDGGKRAKMTKTKKAKTKTTPLPIEVDAQEIGTGAKLVGHLTFDEATDIKVTAGMETGDLGMAVQTTGEAEKVWEERLSGDDEQIVTIDAGDYYIVAVGGPDEAAGTVTVDLAGQD